MINANSDTLENGNEANLANIKERHPEKKNKPNSRVLKKPSWLKVKAPNSQGFFDTKRIIGESRVFTVCEEASCPNLFSWQYFYENHSLIQSIFQKSDDILVKKKTLIDKIMSNKK